MKNILLLLLALLCTGPAGRLLAQVALCVGHTSALSGGTAGSWLSTNTGVATVGTTGIVTGVAAGTSVISYTVTGGTARAAITVTVQTAPVAGAISGPTAVCIAAHITLTDPAGGGSWSSGAAAAVAGGTVTGVAAGADIVSYTVTNSCGSASATHSLTVDALPFGGAISSSTTGFGLCAGASARIDDAATPGTWSSSCSCASVAGGTVTGVSAGTAIITLMVTNSCGTGYETRVFNITAVPSAGAISGPAAVCRYLSVTLTQSGDAGGSWTSLHGNVSMSGPIATGHVIGGDIISYTVGNRCGSSYTTYSMTVGAAPIAGSISGTSGSLCVDSTMLLDWSGTGGAWSASNADASISGGVVTGVSPGSTIISYTVSNTCGSVSATFDLTINDCSLSVPMVHGAGADILLLPNPTNGTFTVKGNIGKPGSPGTMLVVRDLLGQEVYQKKAVASNGALNEQVQLPPDLPNGIYVVAIQCGSEQAVVRIVLDR